MKKKIIISTGFFIILLISTLVYINCCSFKNVQNRKVEIVNKTIKTKNSHVRKTYNRRQSPEFVQGLYVTAYTVQSKRFDSLLKKAKESGINTIVFDVKEMDGVVYFSLESDSTIHYLKSISLWDIDRVVEKIHQNDLFAVARIVQFFNISSAKAYPFLQIENKNGGYWTEKVSKSSWLDPSKPEVQRDLKGLIERIAKSEIDEIQMDYVRFPTEGHLQSAQFFYEKEDEKFKSDSTYVKREKRHVIAAYVKSVRQICDAYKVRLSADIFAIVAWQVAIDIKNTGQDIGLMTKSLHQLHPMIYSSHFANNFQFRQDDFYNHPYGLLCEGLTKTKQYTDNNCQVVPYLQAFNWKVNYTENYINEQLNAVIDTGCQGYILWNAGNNYDKTLSWVFNWNEKRKNIKQNKQEQSIN